MSQKCIDCDNSAEWVRCTQFAGDHHFCDRCARKERRFGEDVPGQFYWVTIEQWYRVD